MLTTHKMTADRNGTPKWATQVSRVPAFAPVKLRLASGSGSWIGFLIRARLVLLFFIRLSSLRLLSVLFIRAALPEINWFYCIIIVNHTNICKTTLFHWSHGSRRCQLASTDGISNTIETFRSLDAWPLHLWTITTLDFCVTDTQCVCLSFFFPRLQTNFILH